MSEWLQIAGVIVVIVAALGGAWSVLTATKIRNDISSLQASNTELRNTVSYVRSERKGEQELCAERVQALELKVDILQSEVVRGLVREFSTALREALQEVLGRSESSPNGGHE